MSVEALVPSFDSMEMESCQITDSGIQQKPMENHVNREQQTDENPGSEVNEEPMEKCQDTVSETDVNPEKQADLKAILEVEQKPVDSCQETVVGSDVNPEKQADLKATSEVGQKPTESCQETVVESDFNPEKQACNPGVIYRCKRCRRMVATQEYVVTHEVGRGEESFKTRKRFHVEENKPECMCIFVEPMKWMQAVEEGYVSDKLFCMGCKARLGQFNWAGMQCTCGTWVIPAFQLTKSKIDECSM
ncbi:hypothetical protein ACP4OV_010033 [Aristida adscensionis]